MNTRPKLFSSVPRNGASSPSRQRGQAIPRISRRRPCSPLCDGCLKIRRVVFGRTHRFKIEKVKNGFTLICTDGTQLFTKQCILTCGGAASPRHSCGEGYTRRKAARPYGDKAVPVFNAAYCARKAVENASRHARPKRRAFADNKPVWRRKRRGAVYVIPAFPAFACSAFPYMSASSLRSARSAIRSALHFRASSIFCRTWPIRRARLSP